LLISLVSKLVGKWCRNVQGVVFMFICTHE
jgi:hypothetical protein